MLFSAVPECNSYIRSTLFPPRKQLCPEMSFWFCFCRQSAKSCLSISRRLTPFLRPLLWPVVNAQCQQALLVVRTEVYSVDLTIFFY